MSARRPGGIRPPRGRGCTFRKLWRVISGTSGAFGRWCLWAGVEVKRRVAGTVGAPAEFDMPAALEHAVEDGLGEIRVVQHAAPRGERLVGGEDHRALVQVAVIHDLEEDVGCVRAIAEIADLVDDEHVGMGVGGQGVP